MGLDFSPRFADSTMGGFCNPSLTCLPWGFSPLNTHCIALYVGVPFDHNSDH